MAKFRGSKGNLTIGGNSVANLSSWEFEIERPHIDGTDMGDNGVEGTLDIPRGRGRARVKLDKTDTAQAAMLDQLVANTDPTPLAAVFLIATGKSINCNVLATRGSIVANIGQYITADIDLVSDGAITMPWA